MDLPVDVVDRPVTVGVTGTHSTGKSTFLARLAHELRLRHIEVATVAGKGTTFTLYLPLTLAIAQTVLVRAGGRLWALPAPMVEQVQQIRDRDLINLYLSREVNWQGRKYPFFYLPRLLGNAGNNPETTRYNSVVLLKSGQNVTAVHVDEMIGNQEVVVKNIGPQLARVSGISGATVLGTGPFSSVDVDVRGTWASCRA